MVKGGGPMLQRCPTCQQPLYDRRFGVRLPPLKAAIFDAIEAAGELGIKSDEIANAIYEGRRRAGLACIKAHVAQINDLLVETDFHIVSDRRRWFLVRR
jgi:hypothetical protein